MRWSCVLLLGLAWPVAAQSLDTVYADVEVVAHVPLAQRIASDDLGFIYVVTGREVVRLDLEGQILTRLGGSGTAPGAFGEVTDTDPGEGLIWLVADASQGRVMRFSQDGMHLESLPVPTGEDIGFGWPSRQEPRDTGPTEVGRPVEVAATPSGELFAIEEDARVVIKWDASRRLERTIGHFGDAGGQLQDPVGLAADDSFVYVADQGLELVRVYDTFGGHVRDWPVGADLVDVTSHGAEVWIVQSGGIRIYAVTGEFRQQIRFNLDEDLSGAVSSGGYIVLLTGDTIARVRR